MDRLSKGDESTDDQWLVGVGAWGEEGIGGRGRGGSEGDDENMSGAGKKPGGSCGSYSDFTSGDGGS